MSTNRGSMVPDAIEQVRAQRGVDVELVVGLHGVDRASLGDVSFEGGAIVSATVVEVPATTLFGDVLQSLTDLVAAEHVAKWDDDDRYGPHHLLDLWLFSVLSGAPLVGKAAEFVLLEQGGLLLRRRGGRPYATSRFLAGGALMFSSAALRGAGGWASIARGVDQEIIRRFEHEGLRTFRIHGYEFVLIRHGEGHTWTADDAYFVENADEIWSSSGLSRSGVSAEDSMPAPPLPAGVGEPTGPALAVSVCVPNHGNQRSVELFERRMPAASPPAELVVCDDRSEPPLASTGRFARTTIVRAPASSGFGAGRSRQAAVGASEGELLCLVDADMYVSDDALADVRRVFDDGFRGVVHAEIGFTRVGTADVLGLLERGTAVDDVLESQRIPGQQWRERHWSGSSDLAWPRSSSYRATVGAFVAIDRTTYERVGGFRDVPARGVEDVEFGYRCLLSGCEQLVHRGPGIWHLGERTFSARLSDAEESIRDRHLAAFVPVWSRTLAERRSVLADGWSGPIAPFAWVADESRRDPLHEQLVAARGPGTAGGGGLATLLDAPFAVATSLADDTAVQAVDRAHHAFRNRACGEVVVLDGDRTVGRFVALWAANLARTRLARPPAIELGELLDDEVLDAVRASFGIAVVAR